MSNGKGSKQQHLLYPTAIKGAKFRFIDPYLTKLSTIQGLIKIKRATYEIQN